MNRFFRSALFPLVIIAALVWLALQTLGGHGTPAKPQTFSQLYSKAENNPQLIQSVTFVPTGTTDASTSRVKIFGSFGFINANQ